MSENNNETVPDGSSLISRLHRAGRQTIQIC
jgi:hypothetical protein